MGRVLTVGLVVCIASAANYADETETQWGQLRGPVANGVAPQSKPPTEWSEGNNVRWKTALPGHGLSTPIVWGDRVYIQTAVPVGGGSAVESKKDERKAGDEAGRRERGSRGGDGEQRGRGRERGRKRESPSTPYQFTVLALDRATGKPVWERVVREEVPHEGSHGDGSLAPATPATDGEHLYAQFGSRGLYCLSRDGEVVWEKDFGDMRTRNGFGEGSSPAIHGDTIVVIWDHEDESFIVALDKTTSRERWRTERDEPTSWASPLIVEDGERVQVVVSGTKKVRSYDLSSGELVWECGGLGSNCIPTPLAGFGHVYAMSGHREPALLAIRYDGAKGDLTDSEAISWRLGSGTPYVPSPILYGDALYFTQKNSGILSCYNAKTGKPYYDPQRLEELSGIYSSLVGANDRVYVVGRNGATVVLKRGPTFEVVAINKLDDEFSASPAVAGDELYLRGRDHLYCIASN